ncbi:MAG: O-antigen polymerase [Cyanobacteria bacterium SW_9_44_58]|nr:MAG: O-antigen polymerase [Cyanobacteria bacterium SW_9_44_58]
MLISDRFPQLWHWGQRLFFLLPLLPTWGSVGILVVALVAIQKQWRELLKRPLIWGLMLLSLWLLLTAAMAEYPKPAWLGIANFIPFFLVFAGFNVLLETPSQLRRLAWLAVASAIPVAILGIGQIALGWTTPDALQPLLGWVLVEGGNPDGRLAAVFMYTNIAAAYLLVMLTFALGLWVEAYRWQRQQFWQWLGLTAVIILFAIAIALTSSRNAWAIALLVTAIYAVYLRWHWLLALGGVAAATVAGAAFAPSPIDRWLRIMVPRYFWGRLADQTYTRPVETLRTTQWEFTWNLIQQHPIFGWGLRNFTPLYQEQMEIWLGHPHNLPLMLSAEIGIPGMLLLLILVGGAIGRASVLLTVWPTLAPTPGTQQWQQDRLILLTFIAAFGAISLFNFLDVTLFDLRLNLLAWLLLAGIDGVSHYHRRLLFGTQLMR